MHDVVDVAEHLLSQSGPIATSRLHLLLYLAQGHYLAATDLPLFTDSIEAWSEGPVVPTLRRLHGRRTVVGPGDLYRARSERARASASNRASVTRLRTLRPAVLGIRSVRRLHRSVAAHPSPPHPNGARP